MYSCTNLFFKTYNGERAPYIERCAEIISYAEDSVRIINFTYFQNCLGLTKQALNEILKPYLAKRKSRMAINAQRTDDDYTEENYDPDELPRYVQDNPGISADVPAMQLLSEVKQAGGTGMLPFQE